MMRKKLFVVGYPLEHTLSPAMHTAALKELGLPYEYAALEIKPENFKDEIEKLRAPEVAGFNVTIPYKESILPLMNKVTDLARLIGAVNTVKNENGHLVGYNTDAEGFLQSLVLESGIDPVDKQVAILGAGGAARAVATILCKNDVDRLAITDINEKRRQALAQTLREKLGGDIREFAPDSPEFLKVLEKSDIVVNCTPLGMAPRTSECALPTQAQLKPQAVAFDLVYNPKETVFLQRARALGAVGIGGLDMLVRQGALAFKLFTGKTAPFETMKAAAAQKLH